MGRTAIVTGGTGGLGSAVTRGFLDDGWRVVVPWLAEREADRLEQRDGLELVQADLFDEASVAEVVARAASDADHPLAAAVNLVGGFAEGGRVHETPIADFEAQFRLTCARRTSSAPRSSRTCSSAAAARSSACRPAPPSARSRAPPAT